MPTISIIIITWNSEQVLDNCISSLYSHVSVPDFEVIVVDNHSLDPAYLFAFHNRPNLKIIRNPDNLGYSRAANIGIHAASGKLLLILNPDMLFLSNPLPRLMEEMAKDSRIGVIAPLLHDVEGKPQITGYYPTFPSIVQYVLTRTLLAEKFAFLRRLSERFFHARIGHRGISYVDQIPGAFLLFRKDLFGNSPPLNEAYFIWMEDVDFCYRIHQKGFKVATVADEKITHIGGTSFAKKDPLWKRLVSTQSYLIYTKLHFQPAAYWIQAMLVIFDSVARILLFSIFRFGRGLKKIADHHSVEVKILKSLFRGRRGDIQPTT